MPDLACILAMTRVAGKAKQVRVRSDTTVEWLCRSGELERRCEVRGFFLWVCLCDTFPTRSLEGLGEGGNAAPLYDVRACCLKLLHEVGADVLLEGLGGVVAWHRELSLFPVGDEAGAWCCFLAVQAGKCPAA